MKITIKREQRQTSLALPSMSNLRGAAAKTKTIIPFFGLAALLLAVSCDVKDPIYNTPHPDHGKLTLTADWSQRGAGIDIPVSYTVQAGGYSVTLNDGTNTLDHLFEPGTYRTYLYNTPEHITVSGTTATVAAASGNVDGAGQFVQEMPGWLFTCAMDVSVEKDTEYALTATMQQQVRQLTLIIEPTGSTTDRIERIEGYLSGVAGTLDFSAGIHATPANVELQFAKITSGVNAGKYAATVRLLGVAGERQKLNAIIHFTGGNPKAMSLGSDLTTELAAFNADKTKPLTLGGKAVETPTGAGFSATITDWMPGNGNDGEDSSAGMETNH